MKILFVSVVLVITMASSARADYFQFIDNVNNYHLSNWAVYISDRLQGYTDGLGRIRIDRPNGNYDVILKKRDRQDITATLLIDGSKTLKVTSVP